MPGTRTEMTKWRNKHEILRDLAEVAGHASLRIGRPIESYGKPPSGHWEDEEADSNNLHQNCSEDDGTGEPDLKMIQNWLSIIQTIQNDPKEEKNELMETLEVSKLNVLAPEFVPLQNKTNSKVENSSEKHLKNLSSGLMEKMKGIPDTEKAKRNKNVAISSLLKIHDKGLCATKVETEPPLKLLRPDDFLVRFASSGCIEYQSSEGF